MEHRPLILALALAAASNCGPSRAFVPTDAGGHDTYVPPLNDGALPPGGDGCSDAARLVYVLSEDNALYSFRPDLRVFTRIGTLDCPTSAQPNSMAIDRNAVAWVDYVQSGTFGDSVGQVYRVSTADAHCTAASPIAMPEGYFRIGMGFSSDAASGDAESLFVTATGDPLGGSNAGLARVDTMSGALTPLGAFGGALAGQNAELTGTGDGRLYGFFTTTPVQVAQLDKTSGAVIDTTPLPAVETPASWAFSFWGGSFYLYTAPSAATDPERTTNVTRFRPSDGSVDTAYLQNIGFRIVGAGVSTCAPILPPG